MLELIVLNRILVKSYKKIKNARQRQFWLEHLKKETIVESQLANLKCFSENKYEIEYLCVNDSVTSSSNETNFTLSTEE